MKDLRFMDDTEGVVKAIPFAIQGMAEGRVTLAQRVITMLARSTSDAARTFDTGILQDVGQSNVRNSEDLQNDFTAAIAEVRAVIEQDQSVRTDLTDDDILSDILVTDIQVAGDSVTAEIEIISASGESLKTSLEIS